MKNIIAQSLEKLYQEFEKADQMFLDSDMKDMDAYEKGLADAGNDSQRGHQKETGDPRAARKHLTENIGKSKL